MGLRNSELDFSTKQTILKLLSELPISLHLQNTSNGVGFPYAFQKLLMTEAVKLQHSFKLLELINIIGS